MKGFLKTVTFLVLLYALLTLLILTLAISSFLDWTLGTQFFLYSSDTSTQSPVQLFECPWHRILTWQPESVCSLLTKLFRYCHIFDFFLSLLISIGSLVQNYILILTSFELSSHCHSQQLVAVLFQVQVAESGYCLAHALCKILFPTSS